MSTTNLQSLKGKHIVLGICGGIAAYKSAVLLRLLIKAGAEVQVVITPAGKQFITPVTLSALSGKPVVSEFFTANSGEWHSHVDLGLWADAMIIAPATASTIGKMANGIADNMLVTTYLSSKAPVFVAPAMDLDMMAHGSTTRNLDILRSYGNIIIDAASGELASHLTGKGRMREPEEIAQVLADYFQQKDHKPLASKKVLITAGPTVEPIDPVRFISNHSSGKMGYALAEAAAALGADVTVVSGPVSVQCQNPAVNIHKVTTARQMLDACQQHVPDADIVICAAAVADYAPKAYAEHKIKREEAGIESIQLVKNPDIAASLAANRQQGQLFVGFALETDNGVENAKAKIQRKGLDAIVLNSLTDPGAGFGTDTNKVSIITADGDTRHYPLADKKQVAFDILSFLTSLI